MRRELFLLRFVEPDQLLCTHLTAYWIQKNEGPLFEEFAFSFELNLLKIRVKFTVINNNSNDDNKERNDNDDDKEIINDDNKTILIIQGSVSCSS